MGTKNNPGEFDCYDKAEPDEPVFTLLGRDPLAPLLIELWAKMRDAMTLNKGDGKSAEAQACAEDCAAWCAMLGKQPLRLGDHIPRKG